MLVPISLKLFSLKRKKIKTFMKHAKFCIDFIAVKVSLYGAEVF